MAVTAALLVLSAAGRAQTNVTFDATSGSVAGNLVTNTAVVFNRSYTLSYANAISGTGTVTDLAASPGVFLPNTIFALINYSGVWNGGLFTYAGNVPATGMKSCAA